MSTSIDRRDAITGTATCIAATALPGKASYAAPPVCSIAIEAMKAAVMDDDLPLFRLGIDGVDELPPCFSHIIAHFIYSLPLPKARRPRLLPYITRLPGSAGAIELERRRAAYIAVSIVYHVLVPALRAAGHQDHVDALVSAPDLRSIGRAANLVWHDKELRQLRTSGHHACCACNDAELTGFSSPSSVALHAICTMKNVLAEDDEDCLPDPLVDVAFSILDGLFAIDAGLEQSASCTAGRSTMAYFDFDVACWAGGVPGVKKRLLVPTCVVCEGSGVEWVLKSELNESTLDWLGNRIRLSEDGLRVQIRCTGCSGDGRFHERDQAFHHS